MALLGIDLLRMHNNKAVFGNYKQHQAGFFEILKPDDGAAAAAGGSLTIKAAADGSVAVEHKPPGKLDYAELYNLSGELHSVAAILATMLVMQRWQKLLPTEDRHAVRATLQAGG